MPLLREEPPAITGTTHITRYERHHYADTEDRMNIITMTSPTLLVADVITRI